MKKKLNWKKKKVEDFQYWVAKGPLGWEFSIELNENGYEAFVYFGSGDDVPLCQHIGGFKFLNEVKKYCQTWLFNLIVELNKWL
jgi:hypothetical protein